MMRAYESMSDLHQCQSNNSLGIGRTMMSTDTAKIMKNHFTIRRAEGRDDDEEQEEEEGGGLFSSRIVNNDQDRRRVLPAETVPAATTAISQKGLPIPTFRSRRPAGKAADATEAAPTIKVITGNTIIGDFVGFAEMLHRSIILEDWPSVLRLARCAPGAAVAAACSHPIPFRFHGERTTGTILHEAAVRCPPPSVVDALLLLLAPIHHPPRSVIMAAGDGSGGRLPVHLAIMTGASTEAVRLLLRQHPSCRGGATTNAGEFCPSSIRDGEGNVALHHAAMFGTDDVLRVTLEAAALLEIGGSLGGNHATCAAAPAAIVNKRGRTPLHLLCARCSNEGSTAADDTRDSSSSDTSSSSTTCRRKTRPSIIRLETIKSLLEAYPDAVYVKDRNGRLPLHEACNSFRPRLDLLELLLDGAPTGGGPKMAAIRDNRGNTPLDLLRAVRPGLLEPSSRAADADGRDIHPTMARLVRITERAATTRRRTIFSENVLIKARPSLVAARIAGRAAASLHPTSRPSRSASRLILRRCPEQQDAVAPLTDDVRPAEESCLASDGITWRAGWRCWSKKKDDPGTYTRHASPVTTVKKTYTLPR